MFAHLTVSIKLIITIFIYGAVLVSSSLMADSNLLSLKGDEGRLFTQNKFKLSQLKYQYDEIVNLEKKPISEILDLYGVTDYSIEELAKGLYSYARGDFYEKEISCLKFQRKLDKELIIVNPVNIKARIDALTNTGVRILWASMELGSYTQLQRKGVLREKNNPAVCNRLDQLHSELECLVVDLKTCPSSNEFNDKLENKKYEGRYVFNQQLVPVKMAIHGFVNNIIASLADEKSELRQVMLEVAAKKNANLDSFVSEIKRVIKHAILRKVTVSIYNFYSQLPGEIRKNIELGTLIDHAGRAKEASLKIAKLLDKNNVSNQITEAEMVIQSFVHRIANKVQSFDLNLKNNIEEKIKDFSGAKSKELCKRLNLNKVSDSFGFNQIGILPTEKKPFGFRFSFEPNGQYRTLNKIQHDMYNGKLQILVFTSGGSYESKLGCKATKVASFSAIDVGLTIQDVYRIEGKKEDFSKGFRVYQSAMNNIVAQGRDFQRALLSLGVPGGWFKGHPDWKISPQFDSVVVNFSMLGGVQEIPIITDREFVFSPYKVGKELCVQLEKTFFSGLLSKWTDSVKLPIDGWHLRVVSNNAINFCDVLKKNDKTLLPLSNSGLHADISLELYGKIKGEKFNWPASASVIAKPNKINLKAITYGKVPKPIKKYINKLLQKANQSWSFEGSKDISLDLRIGSPGQLEVTNKINIPMYLEVRSKDCAPANLGMSLSLPDSSLKVETGDFQTTVKKLVKCGVQRKVNEYIAENIFDCKKIPKSFFGLKNIKLNADEVADNTCNISMEGTLIGEVVSVDGIIAKMSAKGFKLDFSQAKPSETFSKQIKVQIKQALGAIAKEGLEVDNLRFSKNALSVDVVLNKKEPIGLIDLGSLTISADGKISVKSELSRVVNSRLNSYLKPKLEKVAVRYLPEKVKGFDVYLAYENNEIISRATFSVLVHKDIEPIPAKLELLPELKLKIELNEEFLASQVESGLQKHLNKILRLKAGPVSITPPTYQIGPDFDVTLITGITIELDALGKIKIDKIYFSKKGVDFRGRAEIRPNLTLILIPVPVPVLLTKPGVFYDFSSKEVGALGALTILAPEVDKLFQIDVSLSTDNPDDFISQLILTGEMILIDTIPVVYTEGVLDFKKLEATFDGHTSEVFSKIFAASIKGAMKPKEGTVDINSSLSLFGAEISKTTFDIDVKKCPKRCISGTARVNLLIGKGNVGAKFGPFLLDGLLTMGVELNIFGARLGKADLEAELHRAKLKATVLKIIKLKLVTPSLKQMTPEYIAEVIASLLQVDLKDLLKMLKNLDQLEVQLAPVGKPSDGSEGQDDGAGEGSSKKTTGGHPPTPDGADQDIPPAGSKPSKIPEKIKLPQQRVPVINGNAIVACRKRDLSWGYIAHYNSGNWWYHARHSYLSQKTFNTLCKKSNQATPPTKNKGFVIVDDYRPVKTYNLYSPFYGDSTCVLEDKGRGCMTDFANYVSSYFKPKKDDSSYALVSRPRRFTFNEGVKTTSKTIELVVPSDEEKELDQLDINDPVKQYRVKQLIYEQNGLQVDAIKQYKDTFSIMGLFGDPRKDVSYEVAIPSRQANGADEVIIFTNKTGSKAIFSHACRPRWSYDFINRKWKKPGSLFNCHSAENNESNVKVLRYLKIGNVDVSKPEVVLNHQQTTWILNDVIPAIISKKTVPPLGKQLAFDPKVGKCKVANMNLINIDNKLLLRITKNITRSRGQGKVDSQGIQSTDLLISKLGAHRFWADSGNEHIFSLMASFLACNTRPKQWLAEHRRWINPIVNDSETTLLFYSKRTSNNPYQQVIEIKSKQSPREFYVQRINPYSKVIGEYEKPFTIKLKQQFYNQLIKIHNPIRATIIVNKSEGWESALLEGVGEKQTIVLFRPIGSVPFKSEITLKSKQLKNDRLKKCFRTLLNKEQHDSFESTDLTGIKSYLKLERPATSTGVGPLFLFQSLSENKEIGCEFSQ